MNPRSVLSIGSTLAFVSLLLTAIALGTKSWATGDGHWDASTSGELCTLSYALNWGLFKYDSSTSVICSAVGTVYNDDLYNCHMDCDTVGDEGCQNFRAAQVLSVTAFIFCIASLLLFTFASSRQTVHKFLVSVCTVVAILQAIANISAISAYAAVVNDFTSVNVTYTADGTTSVSTEQLHMHNGYASSLMLAATLASIGEAASAAATLYYVYHNKKVDAAPELEALNG